MSEVNRALEALGRDCARAIVAARPALHRWCQAYIDAAVLTATEFHKLLLAHGWKFPEPVLCRKARGYRKHVRLQKASARR